MEWLPFLCSLGLVGLLASTYKFRVLRRANEKQMAIDRRAKANEHGLVEIREPACDCAPRATAAYHQHADRTAQKLCVENMHRDLRNNGAPRNENQTRQRFTGTRRADRRERRHPRPILPVSRFPGPRELQECVASPEAPFPAPRGGLAGRRDQSGKVHLEQAFPRAGIGVGIGAFGGLAWGLMLALLCSFNPLVGTAAGIVATGTVGGIVGKLSDYGIDDQFIKRIADELQPGTSAIFVLFGRLTPDKVLPHLRQFNGTILTSNLPAEREERLRAALAPLAEQQLGDTPACNN